MSTAEPERQAAGDRAHADAGPFEAQRPRLLGLAYRMLGSLTEAEDVLQEAYLRWRRAEGSGIREPAAWLTATVTRLAIDELRRQQVRRREYVGPWLPEPWLSPEEEAATADPQEQVELADDLSVAFLLILERLGPEERAALLLHDVFDVAYGDIAATLGKRPQAIRQIVSRARRRARGERQRFQVSAGQRRALVQRFQRALRARDETELMALFAEDAVLLSDGGGRVQAALRPIRTADRISRFFLGITRGLDLDTLGIDERLINGMPGFVVTQGGSVLGTFAFEGGDGLIQRVYVVRNPDKLHHV
ncbi:MAG: RNA polymerase sigma factor SigJ [Gammaproteobacteria bacterium]|nr:RNA polymerase sigma factor SigJ [Gammaproteobacteria bacterium]